MNQAVRDYLEATDKFVGGSRGRSMTAPEMIAATLRERIQFGELKPGDPIREIPLALEFDTSRGPVRDALKILEGERLIQVRERAGAFVRDLSGAELRSIFRIRAELSALGMRRAAEAGPHPPALLEALDQGVGLLRAIALAPEPRPSDYIQVRRRGSGLIHRMAGSPYLSRLTVETELEIALHWAAILAKPRQLKSSAAWLRIAAAIRAGDAEAAEHEGRMIVLDSLQELAAARTGEVAGSAAAD